MTDTIILGGGCFWCTESVFQSLAGVHRVTPGYAGGHVQNPTYERVCNERTGHIEVVRVEYDADVIDTEQLLKVFFATHDPTTVDRQGGDIGPQYASVIFYTTPEQQQSARKIMQQAEEIIGEPVVTRLEEAPEFWPAEAYHHNYYRENAQQGYCQFVIAPKLAALRQQFSELLATSTG